MGTSKITRWLIAAGALLLLAILILFITHRALESYVVRKIREEYGDKVRIGGLSVRLFPSISFVADHIVVPQKEENQLPPLISIGKISGETNWAWAMAKHVRMVRLEGLRIEIPPRRQGVFGKHGGSGKSGVVVDQVIADGTILEIFSKKPGKPPMEFELYKLTIRGAGAKQQMDFETVMRNAKPPGEIRSSGKFGPWEGDEDEPAATPVEGTYTFQNADLGVFKGISGTLSSTGKYHGVLDHIEIDGATDTPNFTVQVSGNPVHLTTAFHAVVDGTNGDTYLEPVTGHFGNSSVEARGSVTRSESGKGHIVSLDATVAKGRLEDVLRLAVKQQNVMTGVISFRSKIVIPPGDVEVAEKLQLDGSFAVDEAHFSKVNVQEKVSELSNRGRGDPEASGEGNVASNFRGRFRLDQGTMTFHELQFDVPGVSVRLDGTYGLLDEKMNLQGTATLQAKLSETTTGWKSALLKIVDPIFKKKKAGAVLPIKIGGTAKSPEFGLRAP